MVEIGLISFFAVIFNNKKKINKIKVEWKSTKKSIYLTIVAILCGILFAGGLLVIPTSYALFILGAILWDFIKANKNTKIINSQS